MGGTMPAHPGTPPHVPLIQQWFTVPEATLSPTIRQLMSLNQTTPHPLTKHLLILIRSP